jgi:hypothetical protein
MVEQKKLEDYVLEFDRAHSVTDRVPVGIEYYTTDDTLSPIIKGYDLGITRMTLELLVSEDFSDRIDWLLEYSAHDRAVIFKIDLLNDEQRPVLYHAGIAGHCELDTFANGYRTEAAPSLISSGGNGAICLEYEADEPQPDITPDRIVANLSLTKLQQVKFYQKV